MPNKYDKEIDKLEKQRDKQFTDEVFSYQDTIQEETEAITSKTVNKAGEDKNYFRSLPKQLALIKLLREKVRPIMKKRDGFIYKVYVNEYPTEYTQSGYKTVNEGIQEGFEVKLRKFTSKQFTGARDNPLSKLVNTAKMQTSRSAEVNQLYTTITNGVGQGKSLKNITRDLDIVLGYRDGAGQWIAKPELRKGQTYKTMRVLRTEIGRVRSDARTDQWVNEQSIVPSKLIWQATFDDRTRQQSAQMDGQVSNDKGEFRYPNGVVARHRESGVAAYDIHERCTIHSEDKDFSNNKKLARDPKTGKTYISTYKNYEEYAKDVGLTKNRYGQYLFK